MNARLTLAIIVLLAVMIGAAALPSRDVTTPSLSATPSATPGVSSFRAGFQPLLQRAAVQAETLVAMGEARERNLLRLRAEQNAMNEALAAADAWLAAHAPTPADRAAVDAYRRGAAVVREAMGEAQAGFLHFDFDRVAAATELMRQGATDLAHAASLVSG